MAQDWARLLYMYTAKDAIAEDALDWLRGSELAAVAGNSDVIAEFR